MKEERHNNYWKAEQWTKFADAVIVTVRVSIVEEGLWDSTNSSAIEPDPKATESQQIAISVV